MSEIIDRLFDPNARARVAAAVSDAERGTSGEIVPCIVEQSDEYEESIWLAALIGGGLALIVVALVDIASDSWAVLTLSLFALVIAGATSIAALIAALSPGLRIMLAGRSTVDRRTQQAARTAFITEEVFRTRDRTGILIFLSIREHRVVVLGDSGVNALVEQPAWDGVVRAIVNGIQSGKPVDALVDAIGRCGEILSKAGCLLEPEDVNELPDSMRFGVTAIDSQRPPR